MARSILFLAAGIAVLLFCICPAQAFTAKTLDIVVQENGDATITFDYDMSWYENAVVFARIADPAKELKKAIDSNYNTDAEVLSTSGSEAKILVRGFAKSTTKDGTTTMTTPALSFQSAEKVLKQYWFAPLISADFSPELTRVVFPDGYVAQFGNQIAIPKVSHVIAG